jgi:uncharacterized protein YeaO (DUF488 family)
MADAHRTVRVARIYEEPTDDDGRWSGHDPERFEEFSARYRAELSEGEQAEALSRIAADARNGVVALLTATKVPEISEAVVIKSVIEGLE